MFSSSYKLKEAVICFGLKPPFSNKDEIKKAYRKLSIKHHPDKGGDIEEMKKINGYKDLLEENFNELNNIYSKINNSDNIVKKEKYDNEFNKSSYQKNETTKGIIYYIFYPIKYIFNHIINIFEFIIYLIFYSLSIVIKYFFLFLIYLLVFIIPLFFFGKILYILEPLYENGGDLILETLLFIKMLSIYILIILIYTFIYYKYIKKDLLNKVNKIILRIEDTKILTKKAKDIEFISNILKVVKYKGLYYFIGLYFITYILVYFIYLIN